MIAGCKFIIFITIYFYRDGVCPISGECNVTYFQDKFVDGVIQQLIVQCYNETNGCRWSDKLKLLEVDECFY